MEFKADTIQNLVGTDLTDKFSMDLLCVEAEIEMPNDGKYSVAIILEGKAELTFGDEKIIVSKGDELFIDASTPDIHWQGCASVTRTEAGIKVSNTLIFIPKVSRIDSITDLSFTVRTSTIVKRIPSILKSGLIPRFTCE